jgi:hypothetical protein
MIAKKILCEERLRRVPPGFSWVDHRLVRQGLLRRAEAKAWALYLVLVTVGDENGLSYYGDQSLGRLLSLTPEEIAAGRRQLERAGVIAYEKPFYQVLGLDSAEEIP